MDQTKFKNLCRATSRALNDKDPEAFAETGMTEIDGVPVGLFLKRLRRLTASSVTSTLARSQS